MHCWRSATLVSVPHHLFDHAGHHHLDHPGLELASTGTSKIFMKIATCPRQSSRLRVCLDQLGLDKPRIQPDPLPRLQVVGKFKASHPPAVQALDPVSHSSHHPLDLRKGRMRRRNPPPCHQGCSDDMNVWAGSGIRPCLLPAFHSCLLPAFHSFQAQSRRMLRARLVPARCQSKQAHRMLT